MNAVCNQYLNNWIVNKDIMLQYKDFFVTDLAESAEYKNKILSVYDVVKDKWQDYGPPRTKMYDADPGGYCAKIEIIEDAVILDSTDMHSYVSEMLDPEHIFDIKFKLRFFLIKTGLQLTGHFDVPLSVIIYQLNDEVNNICFSDIGNEIFSCDYRYSLMNSHIKHSVPYIGKDRFFFKISIANYGYFQMRELLQYYGKI